jgi:hypothetical protein
MSRTTTVMRRPARILAVAAAFSLLAACGGPGSDADKPEASAEVPTGTLTAGQLATAAVDGGDVPDHQVGGRAAADRYKDSEVDAGQPECVVQAKAALGMAVGDPVSVVERTAMGRPSGAEAAGTDLLKTTVTLASYKGKGKNKGEEKALYDLGYASTACRQGFAMTVRGKETVVQAPAHQVNEQDLGFADEYTWFTLTGPPGIDALTRKVLVVRTGHTLGFFSRTYPGYATDAAQTTMPFPTDVARAQWKKLAAR